MDKYELNIFWCVVGVVRERKRSKYDFMGSCDVQF